ncbi:gap junction delta-4 protein [Echeneis naucrates]|uniref:gap junction delta-4 protein n=1 Tax=Echeneis naucrates TaxID=173247 RepID=UPI0011145712|nr:gap junction delta-4 protein [Echeneis naucrates]
MAGPSASEIIFISVNHSITLMGKVWLIVMIFLRIMMLLFAGYPLYQDEQERFVCNTIQPGCANVCYDLFSPISLFRFWLVQLITLCLPYIVFIIYVAHKVLKGLTVDLNPSGPIRALPLLKIHQERLSQASVNKMPLLVEQGWAQCFTGAYILHLMFRTLLEAGFGVAHYYLFGFYIPRRFLCQHPPCITQVDCYISRPTEKTVMLNFMLSVAVLSLFLNVLDFLCSIKRSMRQKRTKEMMVEKIYEEEQCFISARQTSRGMDLNASMARQDSEGEGSRFGSFRKRQGSKSSCGGEVLASGQEQLCLEHSSLPSSSGSPRGNTNGNNGYSLSQGEALERNGSEVALCPAEPLGTPRSICVSKHNRLKPPPPPRRDHGLPPGAMVKPSGDVSTITTVCTRRVGQYTLVEQGSSTELQANDDGQEKRSAWV